MAEQQFDEDVSRLNTPYTISLLCWNVQKLKHDSSEKIINYLRESKADLCFLQEVAIANARTRMERAKSELRLLLKDDIYGIAPFQEAGQITPAWNFLLYKNDLFEVCKLPHSPAAYRSFAEYNKDNGKRVCIGILQCVDIPQEPKIIIASCHLPRKEGKTTDNASKLFANLDELRQKTGYPVIVAGDFNCDIRPTKTTGDRVVLKCFEVPTYNPTIHRVLFSGNKSTCIDFFSYKNCDDVDRSVRVRVDNVCAELIRPSRDAAHLVSCNNGQVNFLQYQQYISEEKSKSALHQIHAISDHDPLKATLTIEVAPPSLVLCSYYRMDGGEQELITGYFDKLHSSPNLSLYRENSNISMANLESNSIPSDNIKIVCVHMHTDDPLRYLVWSVKYKSNASNIAEIFVALIQKELVNPSREVNKEDINTLFTFLGKNYLPFCATVVAGDINIYKFLEEDPSITGKFNVPRYNPTMHSLVHGGIYNDHISFFAFQNSSNRKAVKISLSNVHAEMIAPCPPNHLTTQNEQPRFNYYLCHKELDKIHAASPYDPLLATITFGVTPSFHILYSDLKNSKLDEMCQYFSGLNPKPDLCIYKGFNEFTMQQLCRGFETVDKQCQHLIAYDSSKFAYKKYFKLNAPWDSYVGIHFLQCLGVARNPLFILVTYVDCYKDKIKNIEEVLNYFSEQQEDIYKCPVYIAGQFNVDVYKETTLNRHGFEVPMYAPTVYNVLHQGCKCPNYFAYKNPTNVQNSAAITVSNVVAEMIVPIPGLVTGLSNVNISEDFKLNNGTALRATMRIEVTM